MDVTHRAIVFDCEDEHLVGVITEPQRASSRGVLVMVGGPQYRVGSHRQFTLLARRLAEAGYVVMRFDCRGMGDSTGDVTDFEDLAPDMRAAIDAFFAEAPGVREIVIWALCDGAAATLLHVSGDPRVAGLVLLNPWMRSTQSEARTYLKHYYRRRLFSRELWKKLARGELELGRSAAALRDTVYSALRGGKVRPADNPGAGTRDEPLSLRMAEGLARCRGRVLLILSGNDLLAKEFMDLTASSPRWRRLLAAARVTRRFLPGATHTFAARAWRDQVVDWTRGWLRSW